MSALRQRLAIALVSTGVLVATLGLAALLAGCTAHGAPVGVGGWGTVTATAAVVQSEGLGYERAYPSAGVEVAGGEHFTWRVEAAAAQSKKLETDDGWGARAAALAGVRRGDFALLAGPAWTYQETSAWSKSATYAQAELGFSRSPHEFRLYGDWRLEDVTGLPGGQVQSVLGAFWRGGRRWGAEIGYERVHFLSWGSPMRGYRWTLGAFFRSNSPPWKRAGR